LEVDVAFVIAGASVAALGVREIAPLPLLEALVRWNVQMKEIPVIEPG
jgi:hypothetical protein